MARSSRELSRKLKLVEVALGRDKADLVVKNGNLLNVFSGRIVEGAGVAVKDGLIALVGDVDRAIGQGTKVLDAKGLYLIPGFVDGHVHVESSLLSLTQFARAVLPRGTTSAVLDPHEIANVLGLRGIKLLMKEAEGLPLKVFFEAPSCVPSARGLETPGAKVTLRDIKRLMRDERVVALGELMDFQSVLAGRRESLTKILAAEAVGKPVEGHAPGLTGPSLAAYAGAGVWSNHEASGPEEAVEDVEAGLRLEIREGSAARNLSALVKGLLGAGVGFRRCMLVSDDRNCVDLSREGHMDYIVAKAVEEGADPVEAIRMATLNPAEHFRIEGSVGALAPGRAADILLVERLEKPTPSLVVASGEPVAKDGKLIKGLREPDYPSYAKKTVRLPKGLNEEKLKVKVEAERGEAAVTVIGVVEGRLATRRLVERLPVEGWEVKADPGRDVVKVAVLERHGKGGGVGLGFVKGFGLREGAIASTVAHDSHNLIAVGVEASDMLAAARELERMGGGLIAVNKGKPIASLTLRLAGLMSLKPLEEVCAEHERLHGAAGALGVKLRNPFLQMSFLTLTSIPEVKITDKGVVDVKEGKIIDPVVSILKAGGEVG